MKTLFVLLLAFVAIGPARAAVLRVGYFPNVTHAQAIIGSHGTREGRGWFEQRLGTDVQIRWFAYNAGPSAMEAMLAGSIDLAYVGPNPALNAHIRARGAEIRVLAGAAEGGAALVVNGQAGIDGPEDLKGRRVATPQLGNTQDVAARAWLKRHGYRITLTGGDVTVIPTANADQLGLFRQGRVDAVWTVEPWVSRLEQEAGGRVLFEQADAVTTVLVASVRACQAQPELLAKFTAAHRDLTAWIGAHGEEARREVRAGLGAEMRREIPAALVEGAWRRLRFTDRVTPGQFETLVADAQGVGFLRNAIPLDRLFAGTP